MAATEENWAEDAPQEQAQDWGAENEDLAIEEDANEPKMFGKWELSEVQCKDMALADYIKFDKANANTWLITAPGSTRPGSRKPSAISLRGWSML